jgi:threonine dehydratase
MDRLENIKNQLAELDLKSMEISEADLFDKFCDPKNPVRIQFNDISAAAYRIKGGVEYTPCNVAFYSHFSTLKVQVPMDLTI